MSPDPTSIIPIMPSWPATAANLLIMHYHHVALRHYMSWARLSIRMVLIRRGTIRGHWQRAAQALFRHDQHSKLYFDSDIDSDHTTFALASNLVPGNMVLQELGMSRNSISDKGATAMANALASNSQLVSDFPNTAPRLQVAESAIPFHHTPYFLSINSQICDVIGRMCNVTVMTM